MNWATVVKQLIILLAAGLIIWGVFLPLLGVPVFHDRTYYEVSPTGGTIIILLATASVILATLRRFGGLYITGLLAMALLIYSTGAIQREKTHVERDIRQHVADVPGKGAVQKVVSDTRLRHGFVLMAVGTVILVAVPLLGSRLMPARREERPEAR